MISESDRHRLLQELNDPEFDDIKTSGDGMQALVDAIQQQTKVNRICAAALLYGLPTMPEPKKPQPVRSARRAQ